MGQAQVTPKILLLSHFSEIRAKGHNYGVEIKKGKFDALCSVEWPTFNVGWPPQGNFSWTQLRRSTMSLINLVFMATLINIPTSLCVKL
jgi:hypothetical protein